LAVALPLPMLPDVIVMKVALLVPIQLQPLAVDTLMLPVPPVAENDWLDRAAEGLERFGCDFVGGKVLPLWRGPQPAWLPNGPGLHWAVIALMDFGLEPAEFGCNGIPWPLGVNEVTRREAFTRVGLFDNQLGRKAGTLRNQANREWHLRARELGIRGFYIPEMVVHHVI